MITLNNKERLILMMIDDIKHYELEIIALRKHLAKEYPLLNNELLSDLSPLFLLNDEYLKLVDKIKYNPYFDDYRYKKIQKEIIKNGYSKKGYPFSIY